MNKPGGRVKPVLDSYQDKGQGMSMDWHALPFFYALPTFPGRFEHETDTSLSPLWVFRANCLSGLPQEPTISAWEP